MPEQEKLGIELVEDMAKAIIDSVEEGQEAFADGKFQLVEVVNFLDDGKALFNLYNKREQLLAQLKDIDSEERVRLFDFIKTEYDAPNDKAERVVTLVIEIIEEALTVYETGVKSIVGKVKELVSIIKG